MEIEETQELEDVEPAEATLQVAEPPSASDSDSESSESEEDDPEELVMRTDEEVERLFSQLENHFARALRDAQLRLQEAEKLRSRPRFYTKINSRNPKTLSSRRKKIKINTQEMQDQGYRDIRTLFNRLQVPQAPQGETRSESEDEIEEIPNLLHPSSELLISADGEEVVAAERDARNEDFVTITDQSHSGATTSRASPTDYSPESIDEEFQEGGGLDMAVGQDSEHAEAEHLAEDADLAISQVSE